MSTSTTLAKNRKTPGVYVTEFPSFPPSVVGVPTAIPIFIGYTETAADPSSNKPMYMQAVPLSSMADYISYFGQGYNAKGVVKQVADDDTHYDFEAVVMQLSAANPKDLDSKRDKFSIGTSDAPSLSDPAPAEHAAEDKLTTVGQFNLYPAMQMFFANGGGNCYVVSVNNYWGNQSVLPTPDVAGAPLDSTALLNGLKVAETTRGPTMLVVPEACLFAPATVNDKPVYTDYSKIAVAMMKQAKSLQDRVAILDLPGALDPATWSVEAMKTQAVAFYDAISPAADAFSYGAAYGPALQSTALTTTDILYSNLKGTDASILLMNSLLTSQALGLYPNKDDKFSPKFQDVAAHIAAAFPVKASDTAAFGAPTGICGTETAEPKRLMSLPGSVAVTTDPAAMLALDQYLVNAVPLFSQIEQILANELNVVAPSGTMAGIWAYNDTIRGVWNAPANLSLNQVVSPMVDLTDADQGDFNVPLNGNAIDILRSMVSRGTVVWGARTLDGNSLDYRYIQVRRTLNYIEQSIKRALQQFVFAANDGGTWATVTATISNFLTQFWQAGGLMGDKASDAFTVNCGTPTTMSGVDILNGYMIVNVTVTLIHPAEFIELTFKQTMQGVAA